MTLGKRIYIKKTPTILVSVLRKLVDFFGQKFARIFFAVLWNHQSDSGQASGFFCMN